MTENTYSIRSRELARKMAGLSAQGDEKQALKAVQTHLRKAPHDIGALNLAGTLAVRLENWALAEKCFTGALAINKTDTETLGNLFRVLKLSNRPDKATAILSRILELEPDNVSALSEKGLMLFDRGDTASALQVFDKCIQIAPAFELGYKNLYSALVTCGRYEEAERIAKLAIQKSTTDYRYTFKVDLVVCLWRSGAIREGHQVAEEIIAELTQLNNPRFRELLARAHCHYGIILMELNELESAREQFTKAVSLDPGNVDPYINLAKACWFTGDLLQAIHWFDKALAIAPDNAELHLHLGIVLRDAGRPELALPYLQSAVVQSPANPELRCYLGMAQFALGQLDQAYENYELRWVRQECGKKSQLAIPEWTGLPESGRSIFVYTEQGIGDDLTFATCLPDLIGRFERVIYICHPKLKKLMVRSFPQIEIRDLDSNLTSHDLGDPDFQIPIGSLPRIFRKTIESFPASQQLLAPDMGKSALFRERLLQNKGKLIVGIAWRSSFESTDRRAIYPQLEFWRPLFSLPDIVWVNLQYGDAGEEIKKAEHDFGVGIINFTEVDHFDDLDSSVALMKACDLVIGPGTSTVVLSAGTGVPTFKLVPYIDVFCMGTDHYPWFPNMVLAVRSLEETWEAPIQRIANIVQALAAERASVRAD
ncbi:MAG: tetratricopeptide repeat protein [Nitrosomonadales bacterium]|nr:tetratricopeptide repeat protein [Nitrosomonadales bacterium]